MEASFRAYYQISEQTSECECLFPYDEYKLVQQKNCETFGSDFANGNGAGR